jgi:RNA recognition motif-containing protein
MNERDLRDLFSAYGQVTNVRIVSDSLTGKSQGFAFISMSNEFGGQRAISKLNNSMQLGRQIHVTEAYETRAMQSLRARAAN